MRSAIRCCRTARSWRATYGVANRNLGTVSVLGPTRMDYHTVIAAVRGAAVTLSSLLEETW